VVSVSQYDIAGIGFPPVVEKQVIASGAVGFGHRPGIEGFVHDQETHAVT